MSRPKLLWVVFFAAVSMLLASVTADPPSESPSAAHSSGNANAVNGVKPRDKAATSETVDRLIQQLDSADFATRETACGKLAAEGKAAIPALEKAAASGNLEVCSRALGVLDKLLKSSDEKTATAAEESLGRLADGDSPAAARKAKSILDKKNGVGENNNPFGRGFGGPMPGGFGGRIIVNGGTLVIGGGGMAKTRSMSINNGVREIEASEGDKTVKIKADPAKGIKIELTDKVDGKQVSKKFEAKDVAELKKKQPEGYKLYKEYGEGGNGGAMQLQLGAAPLQFGVPQPFQLPRRNPMLPAPLPAAPAADISVQLDRAAARLKNMSAQLDLLRRNDAVKNAPAEKKAELKKKIEELSQRLDELKKQLDAK